MKLYAPFEWAYSLSLRSYKINYSSLRLCRIDFGGHMEPFYFTEETKILSKSTRKTTKTFLLLTSSHRNANNWSIIAFSEWNLLVFTTFSIVGQYNHEIENASTSYRYNRVLRYASSLWFPANLKIKRKNKSRPPASIFLKICLRNR